MPISSRRCCEGVSAPAGSVGQRGQAEEVEDVAASLAAPCDAARACARRTAGRSARCRPRVMSPNTRGVWKVRATPCAAKRAAAAPVRSLRRRTSSRPAVGASTPESAWKNVVLPAPLGPMMPTSSPRAHARGRPRRRPTSPPKRTRELARPRASGISHVESSARRSATATRARRAGRAPQDQQRAEHDQVARRETAGAGTR